MHLTQQMDHRSPYHSHRRCLSAPSLSCPMITVKVTFPRPQPRLWHIHTLSYHHFNTMQMSNVHKFRSKVVPITDARVYGCCHQSNLLRWSSSGCMTLRQSRRQGKSRISEMKLPPSQPRPPRQPNLLSATKHYVDPVLCCVQLYTRNVKLQHKTLLRHHRKRWILKQRFEQFL